MKTEQKKRGIWSLMLIMAMLSAEIYPLSMPLDVCAEGKEYVVKDEENSENDEEVLDEEGVKEDEEEKIEEDFNKATPENAFEWDGDTITAYIGDAYSIVIPKKAKMIAQGAFYRNKKIETLSFEAGSQCIKIDTGAFRECSNLNSVVFPEALEVIGISAFKSCSINEIAIPESVNELWSDAFNNNASLKKVTINSKEITNNVDCCFVGCNIEEVILTDGMKTIPQGLFSKGGFEEGIHFDIPDSVESIGTGAFAEIESEYTVKLPKNLIEIGMNAFKESALNGEIVFPVGIKTIHSDAFYGCIGLTSVVYEGTEARWRTVKVENGNDSIISKMNFLNLGVKFGIDYEKEIWSFGNGSFKDESHGFVGPNSDDNGFCIREEDWSRIKTYYCSEAENLKDKVEGNKNGEGALCYGFSLSVAAAHNGWVKLPKDLHAYDFDEHTLSELCIGQVMQNTKRFEARRNEFKKRNNDEKIREVISAAELASDGQVAVMCYGHRIKPEYNHAVVITGIDRNYIDRTGKYDIRICLYDSNVKEGNFTPELYDGVQYHGVAKDLLIDSKTYDWVIDYLGDGQFEFGNKYIGRKDVKRDSVIYFLSSEQEDLMPEYLEFDYIKTSSNNANNVYNNIELGFDIVRSGGDELHLTCGNEMASFSYDEIDHITDGLDYGCDACGSESVSSPVKVYVPKGLDNKYTVSANTGDRFDLSVFGDGHFYRIDADNAEKAEIGESDDVALMGNNGDFAFEVVYDDLPNDSYKIYTVSGNHVGNLFIQPTEDGICIKGDNIDGLEVKMEDGDGNSETVIIDDKDGDGEIDVGRKDGKNKEEEEHAVSVNVPMNPVPVIDETTTELHLIKGQKFTMSDSGWTSANKKYVVISKKNVLTAKKVTAEGIKLSNKGREITVFISQPKMLNKTIKLDVGKEQTITFDYDADDLPILWYSNAPDIATISQNGLVTAHSKGTATITAYIYGKAYSCKVKVTESHIVQERTLHVALNKNKTVSLKGIKKPVWKAEDETIVSIKGNKFKGLKAGDTIISADYEGKIYQIHVYVEDPTINIYGLNDKGKDKYTAMLKAGDRIPLSYNFVEQNVVFKSSNGETAYWDDDVIVAQMPGKAKLTAKINGKTITINVTVNE